MRKQLSITLLVLLVPQVALSAALLNAADTVAGLGTSITLHGMEAQSSIDVTVVPPYGPETTLSTQSDASGNASVRIEGSALTVAGSYSVEAQGTKNTVPVTSAFTVLPDSIDAQQSTLEAESDVLSANGNEVLTVRVIARDRYSNPVSGRRFALISSRPEDQISAATSETDSQGEQIFEVSTSAAGIIDLRAMDLISGKLIAGSVQIAAEGWAIGGNDWNTGSRMLAATMYGTRPSANTYTPPSLAGRRFFGQVGSSFDVVHHFEIRLDRDVKEVTVYEPLSLDISAVDRNGNVVEDYTGTVQIYTTDPEALIPSEIRFTPGDFGVKRLSLSLRFQSPGEPNAIGEPTHVIRVEESGSCAIAGAATCVFGEHEIIVRATEGGGETGRNITVSSPLPDGTVSSDNITVEGKGPPFINIEVTGGLRDVQGETDDSGQFAISIELDTRKTDHTLRVRDASGRYDSGNISIRLDKTPAEAGEITFDPAAPEVNSPVAVRVLSEPGLSAVLVLGDIETKLTESRSASGTYSGIFTPTIAGPTMAIVRLTDSAGNVGEMRVQLSVSSQALPTVTGVRVTSKIEQIDLSWTPLEDPIIEGYRIYIGTEPKNYSSYLDSPDPRGGATVGGLKPGTTYYFAVTALAGDRESKAKSIEVTAVPLGLKLDVTPQDGALLIEWSALDEDTPLSSFKLEYGVEDGNLTEIRILNGDLRAYTLRDLLNDVNYFLRLTPITTTGDMLKDLSAEGQGSPAATGGGFHPTAADPVPFGLIGSGIGAGSGPGPSSFPSQPDIPPSGTVHSGAPSTPDVGLPPIAWWIAGAFSVGAFYIQRQRRKTMQMTLQFLQSMEQRYRH